MRRPNDRRITLRSESLESRAMLAGNVTVRVSGGNLIVDGDDNANQVVISSGPVAGSMLVTGLTGVDGPTKVNGVSKTPIRFNNVTGSIFADLGRGIDTLGLTKLNVTRDVRISDDFGESDIRIGRQTADAFRGVTQGAVRIGGNLTIATGPGADSVAIGEYTDGAPLSGQAVTVTGNVSVSLGASGAPGFIVAGNVLNVGRTQPASNFAVAVGGTFYADLGSGNATSIIDSLSVAGSFDVSSRQEGAGNVAGLLVGSPERSTPLALRVGGDANVNLGIGLGVITMLGFSVAGNLNVNLPTLARFPDEAATPSVYLQDGTVTGSLNITTGAGVNNVNVLGVSAKHLSFVGSGLRDVVTIAGTEQGRRSVFDTMAVSLGGGDDFLMIYDTLVRGLATLDGGAGNETFTRDPTTKFGRLRLINFEN